jgi:hypothetical protein
VDEHQYIGLCGAATATALLAAGCWRLRAAKLRLVAQALLAGTACCEIKLYWSVFRFDCCCTFFYKVVLFKNALGMYVLGEAWAPTDHCTSQVDIVQVHPVRLFMLEEVLFSLSVAAAAHRNNS